jgi:hypothetical protein
MYYTNFCLKDEETYFEKFLCGKKSISLRHKTSS